MSGWVALNYRKSVSRGHKVQYERQDGMLTAWNVEFKKHVFCSLCIPIGFRALARSSGGKEDVSSDVEGPSLAMPVRARGAAAPCRDVWDLEEMD